MGATPPAGAGAGQLRLAFLGDDFTGSTDALEMLAGAGWRCALRASLASYASSRGNGQPLVTTPADAFDREGTRVSSSPRSNQKLLEAEHVHGLDPRGEPFRHKGRPPQPVENPAGRLR